MIVTADHGGKFNGHGPNEPIYRTVPFIVSGPDAKQGGRIFQTPNIADASVTALHHLGIPLNPAWQLDGRPAGLPTVTHFGENLVFNGDAEYSNGYPGFTNPGDNGGNRTDATVPGWVEIDTLTVVTYDSPGFVAHTDAGPPDRGDNFFAGGGANHDTTMSQTIDIQDVANLVDHSRVEFELSAFLGGQDDHNDIAELIATFLDESDQPLGAAVTLQGDTASRRRFSTGLFPRRTSGAVPMGTRRIELVLNMLDDPASPGNFAYADNVSVRLTLVPEPAAGGVFVIGLLTLTWRRRVATP